MTHPIVARLAAREPDDRRQACLDAIDDPSAVLLVDALVPLLGDPDRSVARAASDALARIGSAEPEATRALRQALRGATPTLRWGAAFTLSRLAHPEPGLLPAVVEAMGSGDGDVRWSAARLLVDMARLDPGVLPVVRGLAQAGDDLAVRRMAVFCLRDLAPDDPATANALLEASRAESVPLRRAAFTAFASLIEPPRAVWDRLAEALAGDGDVPTRALAAHAAGSLAEQTARPLPRAVSSLLRGASTAAAGECDEGLRRAARAALARAPGDTPSDDPSQPRAESPASDPGGLER